MQKASWHFALRGECGDRLGAPAAKCAWRNLAQAQSTILGAPKVSAPRNMAAGNTSAHFDFGVVARQRIGAQ